MGFLGKLLGIGIGKTANEIAGAIDRFVETPEEKKAAEMLQMKVQQEPDRWQAEINKIEAGHQSLFVAGWRPAVGWVCVFALSWGWIVGPIVQWVWPEHPMPAIEIGQAISLIMALLGMSAVRTYEKKSGLTG